MHGVGDGGCGGHVVSNNENGTEHTSGMKRAYIRVTPQLRESEQKFTTLDQNSGIKVECCINHQVTRNRMRAAILAPFPNDGGTYKNMLRKYPFSIIKY